MKRKLFSIVTGLAAILLMTVPCLALEPGVYTGFMETSYYNPDTGAIDDGGTKNAALGEGMCRDATDKACLVEVDASGQIWVTARLLLQSSCSDVKIATRHGYNSYGQANLTITAENSGTDSVDYRFPVSDPEDWLQGSMYVTPMGRDVLWYLRVQPNSLTPGSGDFQVQIDLAAAEAAKNAAASANQPAANNNSSSNSNQSTSGSAAIHNSGGSSYSSSTPSAGSGSGSAAASGSTIHNNSNNSSAASAAAANQNNRASGGTGTAAPSAENPAAAQTEAQPETTAADPAAGGVTDAGENPVTEAEAAAAPSAENAEQPGDGNTTAAGSNTAAKKKQEAQREHKNLLLEELEGDGENSFWRWVLLAGILALLVIGGGIAWVLRDRWVDKVADWPLLGRLAGPGSGRGRKGGRRR